MNDLGGYYVRLHPTNPIDWDSQGDAFHQFVRDALDEPVTLTGIDVDDANSADDPKLLAGYQFVSASLSTRLIFLAEVDGIGVHIGPFSESSITPLALEPWYSAFQAADKRLVEAEPTFQWYAAISATGQQIDGVQRCVNSLAFADLTVRAAESPFTEFVEPLTHPDLGGASSVTCFPLVVHGASSGFRWEVAQGRAVQACNDICALLSLVFDDYWRIRSNPRPYEDEIPALPEMRIGSDVTGVHHLLGSVREVAMPDWLPTAVPLIGRDEVLRTAVRVHREALEMEGATPLLFARFVHQCDRRRRREVCRLDRLRRMRNEEGCPQAFSGSTPKGLLRPAN